MLLDVVVILEGSEKGEMYENKKCKRKKEINRKNKTNAWKKQQIIQKRKRERK